MAATKPIKSPKPKKVAVVPKQVQAKTTPKGQLRLGEESDFEEQPQTKKARVAYDDDE